MQMQEISTDTLAVRVRRAERRDIQRLLEMATALAAHHGDVATTSARAIERDLFGTQACAKALVAERDGELAGYALLHSFPQMQWGLRILEINHLFVEDGQRGHGIGRLLVAACVSEARRQECGQMAVSTHPDNARATELYLSLGFQPRETGGTRFRLELPSNGALPEGWI
ncbi:GNAT family N-acetyltransferase [Aliiruegeria lutimaris]|uniref:N-acetylglutamate synthase, GNAT family n=1 Tax=Aliiruegeria lutimaris TaxID=571298 RepID=A0A1G8J8H2_9RHOB|nr:GNAT family N-acetyltransferase [Aliiruegeria lutimaris]SDI27402.1 N-acetylglutamate synthase, GNAT family [Aliiruegeria lutimaris]